MNRNENSNAVPTPAPPRARFRAWYARRAGIGTHAPSVSAPGELQPLGARHALVLREAGVASWEDGAASASSHPTSDGAAGPGVVLLALDGAREGELAAVVVPSALAGAVRLDDEPLGAGLALAGRRACLALADGRLWLDAASELVPEPYDPARHGRDLRCARTRRPLAPGDAVARCPSAGCGVLLQAAAWAPGLACPGCGFDPSARAWTPPRPHPGPAPHRSGRRSWLDAFRRLAPRP